MRSRNIKPGFFQNESLVELLPEARLLFIGLWLMADRDGRLEDRPKRIKMQVFPADPWDVEPMLNDLAEQSLIVRYTVDSKEYICIPAWDKHQNPHVKEKASTIPAWDKHQNPHVKEKASTIPAWDKHQNPHVKEKASTIPAWDKHQNPHVKEKASTIPAPDLHQTSQEITGTDRADSLIPDSLIPDSLIPPPTGGRARKRAPTDFEVTLQMCEWAKSTLGLAANIVKFETEKFMDHSFATAKKDWPATWRNWMRRVEPPKGAGKPSYSEQLQADMASKGML